jgi:TonB family protein
MKLLSTLSLLFMATLCFAQRQNVYFLKNNGDYVTVRDSADFIRIVREPDQGTALYNVFDYYLNGKTKRIGKSQTIEPLKMDGQCINYYKNGNRKILSDYKNGSIVGDEYTFYPNGKVYLLKEYPETPDAKWHGDKSYLIKMCNDSLGTTLVKDGNGHYVGYNDTFTEIVEQGAIKNGKRDSLWKGNFKVNHTTFQENYDNGALISGTATFEDGQTSTYTKSREVAPEFKGGVNAFAKYLSSNIHYPQEAMQRGTQGRVILSFVVEKTGKLADLKVSKSVTYSLDNEALRVLQESPVWVPGTQFGRPVRVKYSVPVSFTLNR